METQLWRIVELQRQLRAYNSEIDDWKKAEVIYNKVVATLEIARIMDTSKEFKPISDSEWSNPREEKWFIGYGVNKGLFISSTRTVVNFLSFRTKELAQKFLVQNRTLVRHYYLA